ncbi:hypothetical protein DIPPA_30284 [Diplonema papillatum]|nr:hypothetical protein DIPPA_30284 [Diplonema papillatum]
MLRNLMALAAIGAAMAAPDACSDATTAEQCAELSKCPEDDTEECPDHEGKKCLWDKKTEVCGCADKCASIPKQYCKEFSCPENEEAKCKWDDTECKCDSNCARGTTPNECAELACEDGTECKWTEDVGCACP